MSNQRIEIVVPDDCIHALVRRENPTSGHWLCEEIYIYFSSNGPVVSVDREFEDLTDGDILEEVR